MDIIDYREYCLSLAGAEESMPFDDKVLVFKVGGKIFTLGNIYEFESINVKCDPEKAIELRERYPSVKPGYHMSKKHWNTIYIDGSVSDNQIKEWIKDSYDLIFSKLSKKLKEEIEGLNKS
jgi:predicted DNA-binding protein (MmcQ/YjbR family)